MDGCRLCLDPFAAGPINPLENDQLKEQLTVVFNFAIDAHREGPCGICQQCSTTVSEFYQFSVKVRKNQEYLSDTLKFQAVEPPVKIEATEFVEAQIVEEGEAIRDREFRKEDSVDLSSDDESYEPTPGESDDDGEVETVEPTPKRTTQRVTKSRKPNPGDEGGSKRKKKASPVSKEEKEANFKRINDFFQMLCDECGFVAEDFSKLHGHYQEVHKRNGYILCCRKKLDNQTKMIEHLRWHENPDAFRCEVCNKSYKSKGNLEKHMLASHSTAEELIFKCDLCPQSFAAKFMLKQHLPQHEKAECPECGKLFAGRSALRSHQKNMHSDVDRRMICDTCGREFLNKPCFERHVKEHAGIETLERLQCNICQKWFRGQHGLKYHKQYIHKDREKTHICDICNKQYPTGRALFSHKQLVHVVEKYECEYCGAKFKQPLNLKEHRTIHTGEVLYSCEYCGKSMNSRANFYVHIKKNHPVEWAVKQQNKKDGKKPQP